MQYLLFIAGFVLLIKGADLLVEGGSSIGKKFNLSDLVIGLTVVSFGTSLPELLVNLVASFSGSSELAVGNVFGSNIANVLLILGVSAMICPLPINRNTYFSEIPFSLIATLLVGFLANANLEIGFAVTKTGAGTGLYISSFDGYILLFFFVLFLGYIYIVAKQGNGTTHEADTVAETTWGKSVGYILLGIVGLYFGGKWVVDGAITVAKVFDMSETFIGLTIVAIGTSLPELVTSVIAAIRKNTDIAVGNAIGSNIFNLLWILGISAAIKPLEFYVISNMDLFMIIIASTMLIMAVIIGKRPIISRWEGFWFVLAYILYMVFLVNRG
jgi:cation:H+ antiporter